MSYRITFAWSLDMAQRRAKDEANTTGEIHVIYELWDERGRYRVLPASAPVMPSPARFIESIMPENLYLTRQV